MCIWTMQIFFKKRWHDSFRYLKTCEKKFRQNEVVMFLKKSKHNFLRQIAGG